MFWFPKLLYNISQVLPVCILHVDVIFIQLGRVSEQQMFTPDTNDFAQNAKGHGVKAGQMRMRGQEKIETYHNRNIINIALKLVSIIIHKADILSILRVEFFWKCAERKSFNLCLSTYFYINKYYE